MPSVVPIDTKSIRSMLRSEKLSKAASEMILRNILLYGIDELEGIKIDFPYSLCRVKGRFEIYHKNFDNKTIKALEDGDIYRLLVDVTEKLGKKFESFLMNHGQIEAFQKKLTLSAPLMNDVVPFAFASDPKWALERASFDPLPNITRSDLKHWDEFLSRMTNADAFMAFIGSLFDQNSKHEQYLWIYSDGEDGKSKAVDALKSLFGSTMMSVDAPVGDKPDKNWTFKFYNASLVVMREAENTKFVNSALFKSLVTREAVSIEKKYRDAIEGIIPARYMVLGNKKPDIEIDQASKRRLIYCELEKPKSKDVYFVKRLISELPEFISACLKKYHELYSNGKIETQNQVLDGLIEEKQEEDLDIFHSLFEYQTGNIIESGDVFRVLKEKYRVNNISYSRLLKVWKTGILI